MYTKTITATTCTAVGSVLLTKSFSARRWPATHLACWAGQLAVLAFPVVQFGEAGEAAAVDLVLSGDSDHALGDGAEGGGAASLLQQGPTTFSSAGYEAGSLLIADSERMADCGPR